MNATKLRWYSVRCIFKVVDQPVYEERITLWNATSFEKAVGLAEAEAHEYAATCAVQYLGLAQVFDLKRDTLSSGTEVFSLMRTSPLEPDEYLNEFFDTGSERQGTMA